MRPAKSTPPTNPTTGPTLLRKRFNGVFETDAPAILCRLLRAQGWSLLSFGGTIDPCTNFLNEDLDYTEVRVYDSGLVIANDEPAIVFRTNLARWSGGDDE